MKAIVRDRYGSPDVLELRDIDVPEVDDDQVLVRVRAASANMADADYMRGRPRIARIGTGFLKPRNRRLGLDVAGIVERVGGRVTSLHPGDEVWADMTEHGYGAFAEYVCAPEAAFRLKPNGLSFEEAAAVPQAAILALQGLRGGGRDIGPGDEVLVNGAGGAVGPFAVQMAKSLGAVVTAVDRTEKLDMLRSIGADHVIDYTREDFTGNGRRYDRILDMAAFRPIWRYRRSLETHGTYVIVGGSVFTFLLAVVLWPITSRSRGRRFGMMMWKPFRSGDMETLEKMIDSGQIVPVIDRRYPLEQVPDALRYIETGQTIGKVVITV
ncbi:MAG: NAD(P)-dependent alcohol dehydrogenase [Acidimicrobiia bacterium]